MRVAVSVIVIVIVTALTTSSATAVGRVGLTETAAIRLPGAACENEQGQFSVASSENGRLIAAGGCGAIFVYREPAGGWSGSVRPLARLTGPGDPGRLTFGPQALSMTASGDTIAATANKAVDIFQEPAGGWRNERATAVLSAPHDSIDTGDDNQGDAVAISGDGDVVVTTDFTFSALEDYKYTYDGEMLIWTRAAGGWRQAKGRNAARILPPADSSMGIAVAVNATGSTIAVGGAGGLLVYSRPSGGWGTGTAAPLPERIHNGDNGLGAEVTMSPTGDTIFTTSTKGSGAGYVLQRAGRSWREQAKLDDGRQTSSSQYGYFASYSGQHTIVIAGADTFTSVFSETGARWRSASHPASKLPNGVNGPLTLAGDGQLLVGGTAVVYVFAPT